MTEAESIATRKVPPLVVAGVFAFVAVALAGGAFWLRVERRRENERTAIGVLEAITTAESLFREKDADRNGALDYGDLARLTKAGLVDTCVGTGTYNGYLFRVGASTSTSEFLWFAVANPEEPGVTGDRAFCVNQSGELFYTTEGCFTVNTTTCTIPSNASPVFIHR